MLLGYKVFRVGAIFSKFFTEISKFRKTFNSLGNIMKKLDLFNVETILVRLLISSKFKNET